VGIAKGVMARGLALTALAGVIVVLAGKPFAALTLTVTALVGIINTLWLAGLVQSVTQPGLPRLSRRVVWRFVARVTLWGFLFAAPGGTLGRGAGGWVLPGGRLAGRDDVERKFAPGGLEALCITSTPSSLDR